MSFSGLDVVWAEDGRNFLHDALNGRGVLGIFEPYAGYLHSVPRLLAVTVSNLPIEMWAVGMVIGCAFIAGLISLAIYVASGAFSLTQQTRVLLSLVTVLAPPLAMEVLGNAANLHTLFLWAAPWVFLAKPKSWWASIVWAVFCFFLATTEIQALIFAPLLAWQIKDRYRWPLRIATLAGFLLQVITALSVHRPMNYGRPSLLSLLQGFFLQAVGPAWVGRSTTAAELVNVIGWWALYLLCVPFLVGTVVIVLRRKLALLSAVAIYLWVGLVGVWAAGYVLNETVSDKYSVMSPQQLMMAGQLRYAVAPAMLLIALLVLSTDKGFDLGRRSVRVTQWTFIVLLGLAVAFSFGLGAQSPRASGPDWVSAVKQAQTVCMQSTEIKFSTDIPIAPAKFPWRIKVPCSRIIPTPTK